MGCCKGCDDGKGCQGDLAMMIGAAVPGVVIADAGGFGMQGMLLMGLASYYVIHAAHKKQPKEMFLKPIPLLVGGAFYYLLKRSGQSPAASVLLALMTVYAFGSYEKRQQRQTHNPRLASLGQFLPGYGDYRRIMIQHDLDDKL